MKIRQLFHLKNVCKNNKNQQTVLDVLTYCQTDPNCRKNFVYKKFKIKDKIDPLIEKDNFAKFKCKYFGKTF